MRAKMLKLMTLRTLSAAMRAELNRDTTVVKNAIVTAVALNQMGDLYKQTQWFGLQTIIRVVRTRHLWNKTTTLSNVLPQFSAT